DGQTAFLTRPGSTLGTPAFMAPELAAGRLEELDALTDLWALGATMFQLLTAEVVHPARNDNELLVLAATAPARSLGLLRPDLDEQLVRVIDRALAFERKQRWPNARAMSSALCAATGQSLDSDAQARTPVLELSETAPEMALPATHRKAPARAGARWAFSLAAVLVILGAFLLKHYAARMSTQARYDTPTQVPVSAAAPLPLASAATNAIKPTETKPLTTPALTAGHMPPVPSTAHPTPNTNQSAHASPKSRTPTPADATDRSKNPLFFPSQ
ncbi:MAG TPA: hypothetical protein VGL19_16985, partial [Polyangiaceae bacterium]